MSTITTWHKVFRIYRLDGTNQPYTNVTHVQSTHEKQVKPEKLQLNLLEHQTACLHAMTDLMKYQFITIADQPLHINPNAKKSYKIKTKAPDSEIYVDVTLNTRAGVIRDPPGTGKTAVTAAALLGSRTKKLQEITTLWGNLYSARSDRLCFKDGKTDVKIAYKKYLPIALIFVNRIIIDQYVKFFSDYAPDLRLLTVEDIYGLRNLYKIAFMGKSLTDYDVIIVKNGDISGEFNPPELKGTFVSHLSKKPIITVMAELFRNTLFESVWMDDFDILGIPTDAPTIPAVFTWFISATRAVQWYGKAHRPSFNSVEDILDNYHAPYINVQQNRELFTFFSIGGEPAFVKASTQMPIYDTRVYAFVNPNEVAVSALNAMATQDSKVFAEMLNADAVQTAGKKANVKATTALDVFQKVLGDEWSAYHDAIKTISYVSTHASYVEKLPVKPPKTSDYTTNRVMEFRKNMEAAGPEAWLHKNITHVDNRLPPIMTDVQRAASQSKETHGKAIERVKDNLKSGECPIMCLPLNACKGIVIMKCCGVTISIEGATMGIKIQDKGHDISGQCPNCRSNINMDKVVIIDQEMDYKDVINEKFDATKTVKDDGSAEGSETEEKKPITKYEALVKMITLTREDFNNEIKDNITKMKVKLDRLVPGTIDLGLSSQEDRKFLIYSNYSETCTIVGEHLTKANVTFAKLTSRREQNIELFRKYHLPNSDPDSLQVLIVPGPKYSAGRDLQNTTDICFMHKVQSADYEAQVSGRGQRLGRINNLTIHWFMYPNEIEQMNHLVAADPLDI